MPKVSRELKFKNQILCLTENFILVLHVVIQMKQVYIVANHVVQYIVVAVILRTIVIVVMHVVKMNLLDTLRDRYKLRNDCMQRGSPIGEPRYINYCVRDVLLYFPCITAEDIFAE